MAVELSDYEKQRLKNIAERQKYFNEFMKENGEETFELPKVTQPKLPKVTQPKTVRTVESENRSRRARPAKKVVYGPVRRSLRASTGRRKYCEREDSDDDVTSNDMERDSDYDPDMERDTDDDPGYVEAKRVKRVLKPRNHNPRLILSPDDVTDDMLANIATRSKKQYSDNGSTCHQCRQKTIDTKTVCRSQDCIGVRGQFCGPCLKNRYGESVAEALLNPAYTNGIKDFIRNNCLKGTADYSSSSNSSSESDSEDENHNDKTNKNKRVTSRQAMQALNVLYQFADQNNADPKVISTLKAIEYMILKISKRVKGNS